MSELDTPDLAAGNRLDCIFRLTGYTSTKAGIGGTTESGGLAAMALREKNMWAGQMVQMCEAVRLLSRSGGATISELMEELGVAESTVKRLKRTLTDMIGPLDEIKGVQAETRFKFPAGSSAHLVLTNEIGLTSDEVLALYALRMQSGLFRGSALRGAIDSAFEKIGKVLSPLTKEMLARYANLFVSVPKNPKDYSDRDHATSKTRPTHAETIDELTWGILERKTCRIGYTPFSDGEISEKHYDINPLHFFERDSGLYLFVVITRFDEIKLLAVERITQVEQTDKQFHWPINFDPEALLSKAFGLYWDDPISVRIWFCAAQARYIRERTWAEQQRVDDQSDGSIILSMDTSGRYDIKKWVMSFGADARLLEPVDLKKEIQQEIKKMAAGYR